MGCYLKRPQLRLRPHTNKQTFFVSMGCYLKRPQLLPAFQHSEPAGFITRFPSISDFLPMSGRIIDLFAGKSTIKLFVCNPRASRKWRPRSGVR